MSDNILLSIQSINTQIDEEWKIMLEAVNQRDTFEMETRMDKIEQLQTIINSLKAWQ